MFPSVIPLYGTDCSRVTHPSAARISSVQALQISPLDLHVLSTPPAFVLSQDQTLMFDLSQGKSPLQKTRQSLPQPPFPCCLLSQNLTVLVASTLRLSAKSTRSSSFSVSFSRFARRPLKPPSAASRGALVSSGVCYYSNVEGRCQGVLATFCRFSLCLSASGARFRT